MTRHCVTMAAGVVLMTWACSAAGEPLHALILSGQNNHAWQETTPALKSILEKSGRFTVEVLEAPQTMTAESLERFDVVVSNWNNWGDAAKVKEWPEAARTAFLDFVRNGKGYVSVHAGSSSFYDWPDYQEMVIAAWKIGETGHGRAHSFSVVPNEVDHPITRGVAPFTTVDELWHRVPLSPGSQVLATAYSTTESKGSGHDEPMVMVRPYGKGHCVSLLLGHDARAMATPSFGVLVARSAEWAATGTVTLPARTIAWSRDDGHVAMSLNGETLWQLNFGKSATKPYIHPLALAGGPVLTWDAPPDHIWHHGLWFSWKYLNGVNFWEEDAKTGHAAGLTLWDSPAIDRRPDGAAQIRFQLRYELPTGEKLLVERRQLDISAPDAQGRYCIEWTSEFEAVAPEVKLDRTPITGEPDGQSWGGYAGLSMRFSAMTSPEVCSDAGPISGAPELNNLDARALDYSGVWEGRAAGLAIIDAPGAGAKPTPWYVITRAKEPFYYFSPAVLYRAPRTLKSGEKLMLRYRIAPHPGRWDSQRLQADLENNGKGNVAQQPRGENKP